ncbi:MAG TPA: IPT/TIG domain-containing protein [Candidatus Methylomirabilis sp.]|nr:IPT/TIG domain-containing protein [Candidatus Methylomirabilis sp.]
MLPPTAFAESRIVSVTPEKGPTSGGTLVTLELAGGVSLGPLEVRFGRRVASDIKREGLSILQVVTPPGDPGPAPVQVMNNLWGTITAPAVFTYVPPAPRLTRLDPTTAPAGSEDTTLWVEGEAFSPTSRLYFGEVVVATTFLSSRRIQARVPAALLATARTLEVAVADGAVGGGRSSGVSFTVANPAPQVIGVEAPPLRVGGQAAPLTVRGGGFRQDSQILVADTALETRFRTGSELTATLPPQLLAGPGTLTVRVVTPGPGGGSSNSVSLPVAAHFPGRLVVFTSNRRAGRNHVYLLDRESGKLDPLEDANSRDANDGYPTISADGRYIAFQTDRNRGQYDVYLFDREARALDPLPELNHPTAFDGFPRISADGRFIVFESDRLNRKPKVFLFDRLTRSLSELTQANDPTADDGLAAISN